VIKIRCGVFSENAVLQSEPPPTENATAFAAAPVDEGRHSFSGAANLFDGKT